jgi:arylsulfatase A-like enzyme/Flp pilus assembly protein TadD
MFSSAVSRLVPRCVATLLALTSLTLLMACNRQPDADATTSGSAAPGDPSLLLITVDTLRADRLEPYGATDVETPNLARLAERGFVFDRAYAVAPITLPSHASILTGLYPPQHGVRNNGINFLRDDLETLAEMLRGQGFRTGAFVAAAVLESRYGLAQGFEVYDDRIGDGKGVSTTRWGVEDRPADEVARAARDWLDGVGTQERFFAWVHLFDPHAPYTPPSPFAERYSTRPYDGEVAYVDAQIGNLLDHPRLGEDVLVTVVGDHGESLDEHGEGTHGILVYDSTLQIPWILDLPSGPGGERIETPASQVDVLPTILDFLSVDAPQDLPGQSLKPVLESDSPGQADPLYGESYQGYSAYGWAPVHTLVSWPWKLIQATSTELYNLQQDPGESTDLASTEQDRVASLQAQLDPFLQASEQQIDLDAETREALRSLGYMATTQPREIEGDPRPDPRDMIGLHNDLLEFFDAGPHSPSETIAELERVLAADPNNLTALRELPQALADAGRHDEIEPVIQRLLLLDANPAPILLLHATLEHQRGRLEDALRLADEALELDPELAKAWAEKTLLLIQLGEADRAREALAMALRQCPTDPWLQIYHARLVDLVDGRQEEATRRLRQAMEEDPTILEGHLFLSESLEASEELQSAVDVIQAALERWPEDPDLHFRAAQLSMRQGDAPTAELHLRRAATLSKGTRPEIQAALEAVRSQTGTAATGSSPSTSGLDQAVALLQAGRLDEAEAAVDRLLFTQPANAHSLSLKAAILTQKGDLSAAEALLRQVLEVDPSQASTWNDLGLIVEQQGRVDEARRHYEKALQADPGLWQAWINLGVSAGRQQDWTRAADYLEQALKVAPEQHDLHLELADLYAGRLNRPDLARNHLSAFLSVAPNDPRVEMVRQRLNQLPDR